MDKNLNLIDLLKGLAYTAKKNLVVIFVLLGICIGGTLALQNTTPPYYEHTLTLRTHPYAKPDVILVLEEVGSDLNEKTLTNELTLDAATLDQIESLEVNKLYGANKDNLEVEIRVTNQTALDPTEDALISYLEAHPRIVEMNSEISTNPIITEDGAQPIQLSKSFALVTGFGPELASPSGPDLMRNLSWGTFTFLLITVLFLLFRFKMPEPK